MVDFFHRFYKILNKMSPFMFYPLLIIHFVLKNHSFRYIFLPTKIKKKNNFVCCSCSFAYLYIIYILLYMKTKLLISLSYWENLKFFQKFEPVQPSLPSFSARSFLHLNIYINTIYIFYIYIIRVYFLSHFTSSKCTLLYIHFLFFPRVFSRCFFHTWVFYFDLSVRA